MGSFLHKCELVEYHARFMLYNRRLVKRTRPDAELALRALAEPRRQELLRLLRDGPRSVGELAAEVDVSQQAVSQHLSVLDRAGLVEARREGTRSVYAVRPEGFAPVEAFVREFWEPRLLALKSEIEKKK
jgi:DNA-binding transcriptional ArsR family regulator